MSRAFSFIALIIVMGVGAYLYMRQTQSITAGGSANPRATVDLIGVRNDLLAIAQAERSHNAMHSGYVSIEELRSQGELAMPRDNRGPYTYSAEVSDGGFRVVATYAGNDPELPHTLSVDESMQVSQQ